VEGRAKNRPTFLGALMVAIFGKNPPKGGKKVSKALRPKIVKA
jgi:hypothetical protein